MDNKNRKNISRHLCVDFDGIIEKTGVYSQFTPDGGPLPLELYLKPKGNFNLEGKAKESKTKTAYNDIFEVNETFFKVKRKYNRLFM
jgi:thiol:disulfide interchange protein DsbD